MSMDHYELPGLSSVYPPWTGERACRGSQTDRFFEHFEAGLLDDQNPQNPGPLTIYPNQQSTYEELEAEREAEMKSVCEGCLTREDCLERALTYHEYGIWGGTNEEEREIIRWEQEIDYGKSMHPGFLAAIIKVDFNRRAQEL